MNQRSRSDQGVAFGPLVGSVKACTSLRHGDIDRKHAPLEPTENLMVDPDAQAGVLRAVLPRDQERAKLDSRIVMAERKKLDAGRALARPSTLRSALSGRRSSEMTLVSSRNISRNRRALQCRRRCAAH
jgi:hypothetical protein